MFAQMKCPKISIETGRGRRPGSNDVGVMRWTSTGKPERGVHASTDKMDNTGHIRSHPNSQRKAEISVREKNKIKNASFLDIGSCRSFPAKFAKRRFGPSPCDRFREAGKFFDEILWVKHHEINSLRVNSISWSATYSFRDFGPGQR